MFSDQHFHFRYDITKKLREKIKRIMNNTFYQTPKTVSEKANEEDMSNNRKME